MTEYTSIPITFTTKERLETFKITRGEHWDDLVNRLLDTVKTVEV